MGQTITASEARRRILAGTLEPGATVNGSLDLSGCTGLKSLPELTVGGWLDLSGCTGLKSLPELTVGGSLYLSGCTGLKNKNPKYKRLKNGDYKPGRYLYADGILTHVRSKRLINNGYTYYVGKIKGRNVISDGKNYAHCKNAREGMAELLFKTAKDRGSDQYKGVSLDDVFTPGELVTMYRIITGACKQGSEQFIESLGKLKKQYTVREAIELTKGQYGADTFRRFFDN